MENASDIDFLTRRYGSARNKYKPRHVRCLLVAEAPPINLDRYFYFEDVKRQDSLFLEIMGALYPEQKQQYLKAGRDPVLKAELLQRFRDEGFWLIDLCEIPCELLQGTPEDLLQSLLNRLQKAIDKKTPIILIKADVFDICYNPLSSEGYNVIKERLPFPGSGQQRVFREKFERALAAI